MIGFRSAMLATTCAALIGGQAAAQTATSPAAAPRRTRTATGTEEIVVTAQRRSERLSRTPVAVAVINAVTLARAAIQTEQDLRSSTPGLAVRQSLGSVLNFALRGQSQDALSSTRPGVLAYLNEVQIAPGGATEFYDLQSVQVLKGPQGTLFGRSATGGAVLYTTARPVDKLTGYVSALGGNYGAQKYEGAINVPIVGQELMARLSGVYQQRDGYQHNIYDNSRVGDSQREGLRGSLTANIGDFHNDLVVDYLNNNSQNVEGVVTGLLPFTGNGPPYVPVQFLYAGTATPLAAATGIGTVQAFLPPAFAGLVPGFYNAYFADPHHPAGGIEAVFAAQRARGPYIVDTDGNNFYKADNLILTNTSTYRINADLQLKNIIGYTHLRNSQAIDVDATPYAISQNAFHNTNTDNSVGTRQVSEELQVLGKALNDRLTYVGGFYFSDETAVSNITSQFFDILLGGLSQHNAFDLTNRTYAGYGQGTYKLNDNGLAFTLGLRYTDETVGKVTLPNDTIRQTLGNPAPPGFSYNQSRTFDKLSWQIGFQQQVDPDLLAYIVSRRAYKSGGFNGALAPLNTDASQAGDAFYAERVIDLEGGAKYAGTISSMPVRFDVAAYNNFDNNSQRVAYAFVGGNVASLTVNVPNGDTYGFEMDGQVKPLEWLTVGGSFNYTHATFGAQPVSVVGVSQVFDQVPDTPGKSGSVFADVTFPILGNITGFVHTDLYGQNRSFTAPRSQDNAGSEINGYILTNFRLGVEDEAVGWSLTGNVRNAFNRVYYVGGFPAGEVYQINTLIPGEPRTFTVEARYNF